MTTYFKDTSDDTMKKVAEDIAKSFITKGINDGTITDVNAATACYVQFYNQAMSSLIEQKKSEQNSIYSAMEHLNFR